MSRLSRFAVGTASALLAWLISAHPFPLQARQWSDPTGRFSVEANLVTADDQSVVLETADNEQMVVPRDQLSTEDQEYVREYLQSRDQTDTSRKGTPDVPPEETGKRASEEAGAKWQFDATWDLRDGDTVKGRLLGFGSQAITVLRERGDIFVDQQKLEDLPQAYQKILPNIVSQIDDVPLEDLEDLEEHLADGGGGPFTYPVEGIQLQSKSGEVLTIPLTLLASEEFKRVAPGFRRWKAAQRENIGAKERSEVEQRERLLLEAYQRQRRPATAVPPPVKYLQLPLLAADAGVTDLWEVLLYPPNPYGYPYTVVVPAESSIIAQRRALQRYPAWRVGTARKLSE